MIKKIALVKWLRPFTNTPAKANRQTSVSAADAKWEEDYLVKKIQGLHPHIDEQFIRPAVKDCILLFNVPETGEKIVACVLNKLKQNEFDSKE